MTSDKCRVLCGEVCMHNHLVNKWLQLHTFSQASDSENAEEEKEEISHKNASY